MPRVPKFRFPAGAAFDYFTEVKKLLKQSHENVIKTFDTKIVSLAKYWNDSSDNTIIKTDDELLEITILLDTLREETLLLYFNEEKVVDIVEKFVSSVSNHNRTQFVRQYKALVGLDPVANNTKLLSILKAANKENVSYIKSIPERYHNEVETTILQGVRRGKSTKDIAKELEKNYGINENRAKFIARDQAGSLTSDLTKARHKDAGLNTFTWQDSGDNNVRNQHQLWNGKVFSWDEGAGPEGILPGEDYGCRCVADINDSELLENIRG